MKLARALLFGGLCVLVTQRVEAGSPFDVVQHLISGRTGKKVGWNRGTPEDAEVERTIHAALRRNLSVDAAVQIALLNNRGLQAQFEEVGISQADLVQAGLLSNPEFAANWRFPDRPPSGTNAEYSVVQDFLDLVILPLRRKLAAQQLQATQLRVSDEVLKLAAEVKSAFYTLQARQQLLATLGTVTETNETAAELSKRLHDAGNINDLELANQQVAYSQSRLDIAQTEGQVRSDRERLNRLMGAWGADTGWRISNQLPEIPARDVSTGKLEALAISQRLDLQATRLQADIAGQFYALRAKTRFLPTSIKLGIDTERETDRQVVTGPALALQVPLFDQGQGAVAKLRAQYRQALFRLEELAVNVRSEVREARDRMLANRDAAEYSRAVLLPQRKQVIELTQQQYNFMLKSSFDLLIAKQSEVATERSYIDVWRDYWIARAELERVVGGSLTGRVRAENESTNFKSASQHN